MEKVAKMPATLETTTDYRVNYLVLGASEVRYFKKYLATSPVEFNLRLDHGLTTGDVREWLTGPDNVL